MCNVTCKDDKISTSLFHYSNRTMISISLALNLMFGEEASIIISGRKYYIKVVATTPFHRGLLSSLMWGDFVWGGFNLIPLGIIPVCWKVRTNKQINHEV